jgi:invasion protein IalB
MQRRFALALISLLAFSGVARAQESGAFAEPSLRATHGDWQVLCVLNENLLEECFIGQALDDQTSGQRAMTAMVMKAPDSSVALRITVPLGVLIPAGLNLTIDGNSVGDVGFVACFPDGCMTQVGMSDEVLGSLKAGSQATVTVHDFDNQPISLPLSLNGFTAAFNDL